MVALYSFCVWAPIAAFAALWGIPFLVSAYNVSTGDAAKLMAFIWIGIGVGSPLIGWWSERIARRCLPLATSAFIGIFSLVGILYLPNLPHALLAFFMFGLGLAAAGQSLSFALVKDNNDADVTGTAIGFNNMAVVAGGAIFQPLVGFLLHEHWHGVTHDGAPVYSTGDYHMAMAVLPVCYIVAAIVSLKFLRETFCRHYTSAERTQSTIGH
jgi:MFS family permease